MNNIELDIGRLFVGKFRSFLNKLKFLGEDIEYLETKGWLSSRFVVKGDAATIVRIREAVEDFKRRLDDDY
jgi:hypothetical protein